MTDEGLDGLVVKITFDSKSDVFWRAWTIGEIADKYGQIENETKSSEFNRRSDSQNVTYKLRGDAFSYAREVLALDYVQSVLIRREEK